MTALINFMYAGWLLGVTLALIFAPYAPVFYNWQTRRTQERNPSAPRRAIEYP